MSGKVFPLAGNQLLAANPLDNVWLSASAGTGKTQVLSARVLRLLLVTEQLERHLPAGRYPIRQRDGRRATVRLNAARPEVVEDEAGRVAGRAALVIDAGRDPAHIARRIAAEGLRHVG